ncbi:MAG: TetR/AcrR family transcriptional regulator [Alphaproteobacteria bacterium]|nr:TetR/AcrR family transcriptional regulator [Alphaproteobacteria bacterium]
MNIQTVRRRMNPDDRRAQLLVCGVRVFANLGIGRASHAEVAREAGVSVATIFNYFPTRENLVEQVLSQVDEFLTEMTATIETSDLGAPEALYKLMRAFADAANTDSDMIRVWLEWSTSIRDDIWPKYLDFQERVIDRLRQMIVNGQRAGVVAADVDPEDAARIVVGDAHMVALMQFAHRASADMDRFLSHLVESVLKVSTVSGASR